MTRNVHPKGVLVRISVTFTNISDDPQDPATASLFVTNSAGVTTEYNSPTVINDPTGFGAFYCDVMTDKAGEFHYRWEGEGVTFVEAARRGEFMVEPSDFVVPPP